MLKNFKFGSTWSSTRQPAAPCGGASLREGDGESEGGWVQSHIYTCNLFLFLYCDLVKSNKQGVTIFGLNIYVHIQHHIVQRSCD